MTETTSEDKAWQRGYAMPLLKQLADVFRATDKGLVLGAFTGYKERDVANAMAEENLAFWWSKAPGEDVPVAAMQWRRVKTSLGVKDFTGEVRTRMQPGDIHVSRLGFLPGHEKEAHDLLFKLMQAEVHRADAETHRADTVFVSIWQEHAPSRALLAAMGVPWQLVAVKIPASSELIGVYAVGRKRKVEHEPLPESETWGLRRLALPLGSERLSSHPRFLAAIEAVRKVDTWENHYSSYNKKHAWSAMALRGFGPSGPDMHGDPGFIIKPVEMGKSWKAAHPAEMGWGVVDTPLRAHLPELEPLIRWIPGDHQRIRLMRLNPGGGELTRHADITDPEAGTGPGKVLRIHIPLVTNPDVVFSSWDLEGRQYRRHMGLGEAWYLDTRKPHTAVNNGATERVHLVIDAYSSPELLGMLARGSNS